MPPRVPDDVFELPEAPLPVQPQPQQQHEQQQQQQQQQQHAARDARQHAASAPLSRAAPQPRGASTLPAEARATPAGTRLDARFWYIHGKAYDLRKYADAHPGGRHMLMIGQGRDCTELVESVHSMTRENWRRVLRAYEVSDAPVPADVAADDLFDFDNESGFFSELKRRARVVLAAEKTTAAPWRFWAWAWPLVAVASFCLWRMVSQASIVYALVASQLVISIGFALMHTASHAGLSKRPWINRWVTMIWCNMFMFLHPLWYQHHIYGHHSYTGIYRKDPDLSNSAAFVRKHPASRRRFLHRFQAWTVWLLLLVLPNQWVGQAIQYLRALRERRLFGMAVRALIEPNDRAPVLGISLASLVGLVVVPLCVHGVRAYLAPLAAFAAGMGFLYWAIVFPNHDTEHGNYEVAPGERRDWGIQMVAETQNFWLPPVLAQLCGGMNYQIEHHLFPAVHPSLYPRLSRVVRQLCAERNVPYVCHASWFAALASYARQIARLSRASSASKPAAAGVDAPVRA